MDFRSAEIQQRFQSLDMQLQKLQDKMDAIRQREQDEKNKYADYKDYIRDSLHRDNHIADVRQAYDVCECLNYSYGEALESNFDYPLIYADFVKLQLNPAVLVKKLRRMGVDRFYFCKRYDSEVYILHNRGTMPAMAFLASLLDEGCTFGKVKHLHLDYKYSPPLSFDGFPVFTIHLPTTEKTL